MAGYLRCRDPGRPVHYEGGGSRTAATDFVCPMYARVHQARSHLSYHWQEPAVCSQVEPLTKSCLMRAPKVGLCSVFACGIAKLANAILMCGVNTGNKFACL